MTKNLNLNNLMRMEISIGKISQYQRILNMTNVRSDIPLTPGNMAYIFAASSEDIFNIIKNIAGDGYKIGSVNDVKMDFLVRIHELSAKRKFVEFKGLDKEDINYLTNHDMKQINDLTNAAFQMETSDDFTPNEYYLYNIKTASVKLLTMQDINDYLNKALSNAFND